MESAHKSGIIAENIPLLPVSFVKWAGNVVLKVKEDLTYDEIQPVNSVKNIHAVYTHFTEQKIKSHHHKVVNIFMMQSHMRKKHYGTLKDKTFVKLLI